MIYENKVLNKTLIGTVPTVRENSTCEIDMTAGPEQAKRSVLVTDRQHTVTTMTIIRRR